MAGIRVVTDSACDLPPELAEEHEIDVVPLTIRFGDQELLDRRDLTPEQFWARCAASPRLPETAAPAPGAFQQAYVRAAEQGAAGVVCVAISSALSATYQSAVTASQAVAGRIPVRVVDSRSVSIGQGLMALTAARMAREGKALDDVAGVAEDLVARTRVFAALDTLENLKRGGRIGGAEAFLGSLLSIKPIIEVRDGVVESESRQRTRGRSLQYLVEKVRQLGDIDNLAVMHANASDVGQLLDLLASVYSRAQILVGQVGPVIGTHAGPGAIGVALHVPG
ncbi:MAG TPA: DegV family protein [Acidimicrobiales bacterium]|nr:DegV family protein [Acidimicrobiales bacterium]